MAQLVLCIPAAIPRGTLRLMKMANQGLRIDCSGAASGLAARRTMYLFAARYRRVPAADRALRYSDYSDILSTRTYRLLLPRTRSLFTATPTRRATGSLMFPKNLFDEFYDRRAASRSTGLPALHNT